MALFKEDMDKIVRQGCQNTNCECCDGPMFFHARCCNDEIEASYEKGVLSINCKKCGKLVVALNVATKPKIVE